MTPFLRLSAPLVILLAGACAGKAPDECVPADEAPYDGVDQDCDGRDLTDADDDGFDGTEAGGNDCDDRDAGIYPSAAEVPYDGVDQDCNGADLVDVDLDGYTAAAVGGDDCDDGDPLLHPGAAEVPYDGIDQDCSGADLSDVDGDGHDAESVGGDDCDDADPSVYGTADETPYDGIDQDCSGADLSDVDADGHDAIESGGDDCDDASSDTHPGAPERCDDLDADEDCDGLADDADPLAADKIAYFADADADGHGSGTPTPYCDPPTGWSPTDDDCDDSDPAVNPAATEVCDLLDTDEDCDGLSDDADASVDLSAGTTYFTDADQDGYGSTPSAVFCDLPLVGYARDSTDCDDTTANVNPAAVEVCDGADVDEDCDGLVDDADDSVTLRADWYADSDGDGYGAGPATSACLAPASAVATDDDCDDADGAVNPGAREVCDPGDVDEDCDGLADDADGSVDSATFSTFYVDADADAFGSNTTSSRCDATAGFAASNTDCDDSVAAVNPGASEVCDAAWTDEDCDGLVEDDDSSATGQMAFYVDADEDGYGVGEAISPLACHPTVGFAEVEGDCDDTDPAMSPGATDIPDDGIDQDCSGVDLLDADGDGFGSIETGGNDCHDTDPGVYPGAPEDESNGIDDDCDGRTDETLVCWDGSGDFRTVQRGIDGTPDGGTVEICPGTYAEDILVSNRELSVFGGGAAPEEVVLAGASTWALQVSGSATELAVSNVAFDDYSTYASDAAAVSLDLIDFCSASSSPHATLSSVGGSVSLTRSWFCPSSGHPYVVLNGNATFAENVVESAAGGQFYLGADFGELTVRNNLLVGGLQEIYASEALGPAFHLYNNTFADGEAMVISGRNEADATPWGTFTFHDNIVSGMSDPAQIVFQITYYSGHTTTPTCSAWLPAPFTANLGFDVMENWMECEAFCHEDDYCTDSDYYDYSEAPLFQAGFTNLDPMFVTNPGEGDYALATGSPGIDSGIGDDDADGTRCDLGAFGGARSNWWQEVPWLD